MATQRQIAANRKNGRKGGPKTDAGKAVVRQNARKHGVFASALTDYDEKQLAGIHDDMIEHLQPVGPIEKMLTEMIALNYVRLQRCVRAEAEYHIMTWDDNPALYVKERYAERTVEGRHATWFQADKFRSSVALFSRYNNSLTNQMVKLMHELERVQRMRLGKETPPPLVADVTVTGEVEMTDDGGPTTEDG